ncbi:MAG: hypothetical protein WD651_14070 [Acidimicrobiia bacterium]
MDDDDRIRELAREGIRPWIGADPQGPTWEQLTADSSSRRRPAWAAAALTAAIVLGGVALLPVLIGGTPGSESSTTEAPTPTTAASTTTSTATSTTGATTTTLPPSGLPLETPVPLQIASVGPEGHGLEVLDLQTGAITSLPLQTILNQVGGAIYNRQREVILWDSEAAFVFSQGLDDYDLELVPAQRSPTGVMWVLPTADGDNAWIVQQGLEGDPTLLEFRNIENGERLITAEADPGLTPVGATVDGLVFNTTDNQVVLFTNSGATLPLGPGRGIATTETAVVRLVCSGDEPADCEEIWVTRSDGTDDRQNVKPDEGMWIALENGSLPVISPDGTKLLIGFGLPSTTLHVVDLEDSGVQPIAELVAGDALATWSTDGAWIALINGGDIDLINAADPPQVVPLRGVIAEGFLPIAAG